MSIDGRPGPGASQPPRPPRPRRSRARVVVPLVFAAWVVLEVWLITLVGRAAGALTVVVLLLAGVVAGGAVIRRAGLRAWRNFAAAVQSGSGAPPESSGAAMLMFAGFLIMLPGFASDVVGLLCLLPPVRALLRKIPERLVARSGGVAAGPVADAYQQARIHRPDGRIVPGEVVDRDRSGPGGGSRRGGDGGPEEGGPGKGGSGR